MGSAYARMTIGKTRATLSHIVHVFRINFLRFRKNYIFGRNLCNEPNLKSRYFAPPRISSKREVQHTWFIVVLIVAIFAFRTSYLELILELSIHALIEIWDSLSILLGNAQTGSYLLIGYQWNSTTDCIFMIFYSENKIRINSYTV